MMTFFLLRRHHHLLLSVCARGIFRIVLESRCSPRVETKSMFSTGLITFYNVRYEVFDAKFQGKTDDVPSSEVCHRATQRPSSYVEQFLLRDSQNPFVSFTRRAPCIITVCTCDFPRNNIQAQWSSDCCFLSSRGWLLNEPVELSSADTCKLDILLVSSVLYADSTGWLSSPRRSCL